MSDIVAEFDPSSDTSTSFTVPSGAANGALVFWNESNISLNLTFQDGTTLYLPAWYNRHKCGASGSVNIKWDVRTILSSASPPTSEIIVESYEQGEHFPSDGPLVRQANVGNVVNTVGGTASAIQNDGNAINTSVVEATVVGDGASAVKLLNNGVFTLGDASYTGFLNLISTALGTLIFGNGKISSSIDLTIQVGAGKTLTIKAGGFPIATVNATQLQANTVAFTTGTLTNISRFSGTGPGTFAHGLGAIPDIILISYHGPYGAAPTSLLSYDSEDGTNVHIVAQTAYNWQAAAIKF